MNKKDLIELLKTDVLKWNERFATLVPKKASQRINLVDANLSGFDLSKANLSRVDLSGADLSGVNLTNASLTGAVLNETNLSDANLKGADLSRTEFLNTNLSNSYLLATDLSNCYMNNVNLTGAKFTGAKLEGTSILDSNISSAELWGTNFTKAILQDVDFSKTQHTESVFRKALFLKVNLSESLFLSPRLERAKLKEVDLFRSKISNGFLVETEFTKVNLTRAKLSNLNLITVILKDVDFSSAILSGVYLSRQNLTSVNFCRANLSGTHLDGSNLMGTDLSKSNLTKAKVKNADLSKAILIEADLREANLEGTILDDSNLSGATLIGANLMHASLKGTNLTCALFDIHSNINLKNSIVDMTSDSRLKIHREGIVIGINGLLNSKNKTVCLTDQILTGDSMEGNDPDTIINSLKRARYFINFSIGIVGFLGLIYSSVLFAPVEGSEVIKFYGVAISLKGLNLISTFLIIGAMTLCISFTSDALMGVRYVTSHADAMRIGKFPWIVSRYTNEYVKTNFVIRLLVIFHPCAMFLITLIYYLKISIDDLRFSLVYFVVFLVLTAMSVLLSARLFVVSRKFQKPILFDFIGERNRESDLQKQTRAIERQTEAIKQVIKILKGNKST